MLLQTRSVHSAASPQKHPVALWPLRKPPLSASLPLRALAKMAVLFPRNKRNNDAQKQNCPDQKLARAEALQEAQYQGVITCTKAA